MKNCLKKLDSYKKEDVIVPDVSPLFFIPIVRYISQRRFSVKVSVQVYNTILVPPIVCYI